MRLLPIITLMALSASAAEPSAQPAKTEYPLWDGKESIAEYAKHANLEPTKTIDLGDGVTMEFVLIPAGTFIMGTEWPAVVDEDHFTTQIWAGKAAVAISVCVLFAMLAFVVARAIRGKHRPQISLARLLVLAVVAGVGLLGGLHWWYSSASFDRAKIEYQASLTRYADAWEQEKPAHEVTIGRPFYLGTHEVTQEQYQAVMDKNPSRFKGRPDLPVERVSWVDAKAFCKKAARAGQEVRLPTEAEWEYACRAGTRMTYCSGDAEADLDEVGWYKKNSDKKTHPVGQKTPNKWGGYDMHGNVSEWCEDDYHYNYEGAPTDGRAWLDQPRSIGRVGRGGNFSANSKYAQCALRGGNESDGRSSGIGFRVVLEPVP